MEVNMTYISPGIVRLGFLTLVATMLTVGICGDAIAKIHKKHLHARNLVFESRAQLVPQQPAGPGAMRYYGGPKSPMWRGQVEN
jgi:hypothetical protein